ncbi:MAG TPA: ACT domain-containing protein [Polyangiaceae bacterium]|nr:ACT domain-containing protein [Polyangiaceae bacterium]
MVHLVLTLIGPDRPGLVGSVAAVVASQGGNWLESRMTRLGGQFAGILRASLPAQNVAGALRALSELEASGLRVVAQTEPPARPADRRTHMELEVLGVDRPGIVREISQLLAAAGVNVEELETGTRSAPMSGEMLFEARARVDVPPGVDLTTLRAELDRAARDLMVDVRLGDADVQRREAGDEGEGAARRHAAMRPRTS